MSRGIRIYRWLLHLFPPAFRGRWGGDMETLFRHRLESAGPNRWSRVRAWAGIIADACSGAARERVRQWRGHRNRGGAGVQSLLQDIRHAVRGLRRAPGVALVATVTLALAIGANTTTFSVVDGVMLKPLPFNEPERIVAVWPAANFNVSLVGELERGVPAFESIAGVSTWTAVLSGAGDPTEIDVGRVSPAFFDVLGIPPALGRTFRSSETLVADAGVVILSHDLWRDRFGSDAQIIGRVIQLDLDTRASHTVVGVMPAGFDPPQRADAWAPLVGEPGLAVADDSTWYVNDRIARLAEGATVAQASEQVRVLAGRLAPQVPNQLSEEVVAAAGVVELRSEMVKGAGRALWVLLGAVGLVLLIACANVANLLLAQGGSTAARSRRSHCPGSREGPASSDCS